jgi:transglutaminase/protease-like cytokinesis protein 3
MRKSKCVVIAISVCVCSILFTACGSDSDINKKKNNKDITTIVDGSVEIETTIVSESTTEQKTITKEDVTTATETTTIPETTTKPETTTPAEATTKQETTKAPETTTKAPVKETSKPVAPGIQNVLNNATLNPFRSDFTPAYEEIDKVFASIFKDGMTTYDKVKACYDYLINNCSYGHNEYVMDYIDAYFTDIHMKSEHTEFLRER